MASHVVMKKSLARALLDGAVQHFDVGGPVGSGSTTGGGVGGFVSNIFGGQNHYSANAPSITTQNVLPSIAQQEGVASDVYGQQQGLAQRLLAESQGQGPNPAQARLNNQTGNNIAETQALMASVRGGNSNPGLTALNAGRQGAATQQQAVGQAAQLEAQQELGAEEQLQSLYGSQAQNALTAQSILQGAQAAQNSALTTGQLGAEETNAQIAGANANNSASTAGGLIGGVGSLLSLSRGGKVPRFAEGGDVPKPEPTPVTDIRWNVPDLGAPETAPPTWMTSPPPKKYDLGGMATYATPIDPREVLAFGNTSSLGTSLSNVGKNSGGPAKKEMKSNFPSSGDTGLDMNSVSPVGGTGGTMGEAGGLAGDAMDVGGGDAGIGGLASLALLAAHGGKIPQYGTGNGFGGAVPTDFRSGGPVPGRAKVKGDSPKNDTVPAYLSPGEEVLPRSVTMAPDAPERAKRFVQALMDKDGDDKGYGKVLKARATLKQRVEHLEKLCYGGRTAA